MANMAVAASSRRAVKRNGDDDGGCGSILPFYPPAGRGYTLGMGRVLLLTAFMIGGAAMGIVVVAIWFPPNPEASIEFRTVQAVQGKLAGPLFGVLAGLIAIRLTLGPRRLSVSELLLVTALVAAAIAGVCLVGWWMAPAWRHPPDR